MNNKPKVAIGTRYVPPKYVHTSEDEDLIQLALLAKHRPPSLWQRICWRIALWFRRAE